MQKWLFCYLIGEVIKKNEKYAFKSERTTSNYNIYILNVALTMLQKYLLHGSPLEQRIIAGTKWLGRYQVQSSRLMAQVIVMVIINAMISNDWKIGIMEESKKSLTVL